LYKYFHIVSKV